ncbi:hypothetical protein ACFPRL_21405 [Pseudoclavibacter helvolus]
MTLMVPSAFAASTRASMLPKSSRLVAVAASAVSPVSPVAGLCEHAVRASPARASVATIESRLFMRSRCPSRNRGGAGDQLACRRSPADWPGGDRPPRSREHQRSPDERGWTPS